MKKLFYIVLCLFIFTSCIDQAKKAFEPKRYPYKIRIVDVHPVQSMRHGLYDDPKLNEEYTDSCESDSAAIYAAIFKLDAKLYTEYRIHGKVEPHLPCITIYDPNGNRVDTTAIKDWSRIAKILGDREGVDEIRKNVVGFNSTMMFDSEQQTNAVIEITNRMFDF